MVKINFLHFTNAPTEEAALALLQDIDPPTLECRTWFFHNESTFQASDDQRLRWGLKRRNLKAKDLELWYWIL